MSVRPAFGGAVFAAVWLFAACNAGDVAVYSEVAGGAPGGAGTGGASPAAGAGGAPSGAGGSPAAGAPAGGSSAGLDAQAGAPDMLCRSNADCPGEWLCLKQACPDMEGVCEPRPVCFDMSPAPVCGCNHVTYWNDCLRRQYGVPASTIGDCGAGAHACFKSNDCAFGATCSHLLLSPTSDCGGPPEPGTCWVTPPDCTTATDSRRWQLCDPPPPPGGAGAPSGGAPSTCLSTCQAVQSGRPAKQLPPSAGCP
jgi:hypothetical protein